jgi:hypothetical protein
MSRPRPKCDPEAGRLADDRLMQETRKDRGGNRHGLVSGGL